MYGAPKLASLTMDKFGQEVASYLALYWCRKMQYFLDLARENHDLDWTFSDAECEGAPKIEEPGFAELPAKTVTVLVLDANARVWMRMSFPEAMKVCLGNFI